jgi:hypothetical protein
MISGAALAEHPGQHPDQIDFRGDPAPDKTLQRLPSRDGMLHIVFKLGPCAEKKWRRLRGFDYLAKVMTGIKFKDGVEVTKVDQVAA